MRNVAKPGFDSKEFVLYCAQQGKVELYDKAMTLLVAPMGGFYNLQAGEENPGKLQMRIAYVLPPDEMALVPQLFAELFRGYEESR